MNPRLADEEVTEELLRPEPGALASTAPSFEPVPIVAAPRRPLIVPAVVVTVALVGALGDWLLPAPILLGGLVLALLAFAVLGPRLLRSGRVLAATLGVLALAFGTVALVPPRDPASDLETRTETFVRVQIARAARGSLAFDTVELGTRPRAWLVAVGERFGEVARENEEVRLLAEARAARVRERAEAWRPVVEGPLRAVFGATWRLGLDRAPRTGWFTALGLLAAGSLLLRMGRRSAWAPRHLPWRFVEVGALVTLTGALIDGAFGRSGTVTLSPHESVTAAGDDAGAWSLGGALRLDAVQVDPARRLFVTARERPAGVSDPVEIVAAGTDALVLWPGPASVQVSAGEDGTAAPRATRVPGRGPPALELHWDRDDGTAWSGWVLLGAARDVRAHNGVKLWLAAPAEARPVLPEGGTPWDDATLGVRFVPAPDGTLTVTTWRGAEPMGELSAPLGQEVVLEDVGLTLTLDQVLPSGSDERHVAEPDPGGASAVKVAIEAPERTREEWLLVDDPLSAVTLGDLRVTARSLPDAPAHVRARLGWGDAAAVDAASDHPVAFGGLVVAPVRAVDGHTTLRVGSAPGWPVVAAGLALVGLGCVGLLTTTLAPSITRPPLPRALLLLPVGAGAIAVALTRVGALAPLEAAALGLGLVGAGGIGLDGWARRARLPYGPRAADLGVAALGAGLALGATWARTLGGHWWGLAPIELLGVGGWLFAVAIRRAPRLGVAR